MVRRKGWAEPKRNSEVANAALTLPKERYDSRPRRLGNDPKRLESIRREALVGNRRSVVHDVMIMPVSAICV